MSLPRVAVLVSGTGRSLENLAELSSRGELAVELALVIADRPSAKALERARRLGIPERLIVYRDTSGPEEFSELVFGALTEARIDLVVLAGFLRLLLLPDEWLGRVINIHPSLLPAFGGKGFWGDHVHRAVLAAGARETGCTVHFVDNQYDTGPHVLQRRVDVRPEDTVETLAGRVFEEEKVALPEAIRTVLSGDVRFERG